MGRYATRSKFCELILNGNYQGVYVLFEQIKWDENRVDIAKMDKNDNAGDSLTGGYIIKIDKPVGGDGEFDWQTKIDTFQGLACSTSFQYDYPKDDRITEEQKEYIEHFVDELERTLASKEFNDPETGYNKFLDASSFIDFFLIQELAHNVDAYKSSTYLYKERDSEGGKLHAGPIWDFNLSLGNTTGCEGESTEGWALDHPCNPAQIPFWRKRLAQDSAYSEQLNVRWVTPMD